MYSQDSGLFRWSFLTRPVPAMGECSTDVLVNSFLPLCLMPFTKSNHENLLCIRISWRFPISPNSNYYELNSPKRKSFAYKYQGMSTSPSNSSSSLFSKTKNFLCVSLCDYIWCSLSGLSCLGPPQMDKGKEGVLLNIYPEQIGMDEMVIDTDGNTLLANLNGHRANPLLNQMYQEEYNQEKEVSSEAISLPIRIVEGKKQPINPNTQDNTLMPKGIHLGSSLSGEGSKDVGETKAGMTNVNVELVWNDSLPITDYLSVDKKELKQELTPKNSGNEELACVKRTDQEQEEYYEDEGEEHFGYEYEIDDQQDQCEYFQSFPPFDDALMSPIINSELPPCTDQDIDEFINYEQADQKEIPLTSGNSYHSVQNFILFSCP